LTIITFTIIKKHRI